MKKKALGLAFVVALLVSSVAVLLLIDSAKANGFPLTYLPEITINGDGSITPQTNLINRTGNIYTLTTDVDGYAIVIERSNIVFDGAGHAINTTNGDSAGLSLHNVNSVTVKNIEVYGRYTNVYLYYSSNCLLTDVKTNNRIYLTDGSNFNTVTQSSIKQLDIGLGYSDSNSILKNNIWELWVGGSNNKFSQNNFLLEEFPGILYDNFWDDGSFGNYWGNYSLKYPNASEIGNLGIGDTSYIIEREHYTTKDYPNASNIDYYPLMYPYDIEKDTISFPTEPPTKEPDLQSQTEPFTFPITFVAVLCALSVAGVAACFLYYRKKRNYDIGFMVDLNSKGIKYVKIVEN